MKKIVNILCGSVVLFLLTACGSHTVKEEVYNSYPEPVYEERYPAPQWNEQQRLEEERLEAERQAEKMRLERERIAAERKARQKVAELKKGKITLNKKLARFTAEIEKNECGSAAREADRITSVFSSKNNELESDLYTAVCLCHLQTGDAHRFTKCFDQLKNLTQSQDYLEKETQFVLELGPHFKQETTTNRDTRIDSRIIRGIENTLN